MPHVSETAINWVPINPELLKRIYEDMVTNAGASVLFNTFVTSVEMETNKEAATIIACNKTGLSAYRAKIYIDCSGDGDIAAWAGADFNKGDDETGELQPATLCFSLSNVDQYAYKYGRVLYGNHEDSPVVDIINSGKYSIIPDRHLVESLIGPGVVGFNAGHIWNVDNTDPTSTSKALIKGRKIAAAYRDALAEFYPEAFSNAFLVSTAILSGTRETRRIVGDYILTVDDYLARRSFEDEICRNSYFIDIHHSEEEIELEKKGKLDIEKRCHHYKKGESHGIPYRCLTPKGLKNIIVAGRSISCDRVVQGSIRVMPVCLVMGEAAGVAAAMTLNMKDKNIHNINTGKLRKLLIKYGNYLP